MSVSHEPWTPLPRSALKCSTCGLSFPEDAILEHLEEFHVGPRRVEEDIRIQCGSCPLSLPLANQALLYFMKHCATSKHPAKNVHINWKTFLSTETTRLLQILMLGEGIEKSRRQIEDPNPTEPHEYPFLEPVSAKLPRKRRKYSRKVSSDKTPKRTGRKRSRMHAEMPETEVNFDKNRDIKDETLDIELDVINRSDAEEIVIVPEQASIEVADESVTEETETQQREVARPEGGGNETTEKSRIDDPFLQDFLSGLPNSRPDHQEPEVQTSATETGDEGRDSTLRSDHRRNSTRPEDSSLFAKLNSSIEEERKKRKKKKKKLKLPKEPSRDSQLRKYPEKKSVAENSVLRSEQENEEQLQQKTETIEAEQSELQPILEPLDSTEMSILPLKTPDTSEKPTSKLEEKSSSQPETPKQTSDELRYFCQLCDYFVLKKDRLRRQKMQFHVFRHDHDVLPLKCKSCVYRSNTKNMIVKHSLRRNSQCDGGYENVQTQEMIDKTRLLLAKIFPEIDWDQYTPRGKTVQDIKW